MPRDPYILEPLESREMLSATLVIPPRHAPVAVVRPPLKDDCLGILPIPPLGTVLTIDGILNVWPGNPTDFGTTWTVDTSNPTLALYGSDGIPNLDSIQQGPTPDCYFLAGIGAVAFSHPDLIQKRIAWDGNGFAVTFGTGASTLVVHTSPEFSKSLQVQSGEVWWEVLEKAFATFRNWNWGRVNTMTSIGWGYAYEPLQAMGITTTDQNWYNLPDAEVITLIASDLAAHQPILFTTSNLAANLPTLHALTIIAVSDDTVTLYNPWGFIETRKTIADLRLDSTIALTVGVL